MSRIPYASAIGNLTYAMTCTQSNIAHSVGVVRKFLANPGKQHWKVVKWILRYLKGTNHDYLCYGSNDVVLIGYTYLDIARDVDTKKSTSGYLCTFAGVAVSWTSNMQKIITLSTTKAEYVAATEVCKDMLWTQ